MSAKTQAMLHSLVLLLYGIVIIVLSIIAYTSVRSNAGNAIDILDNWKTGAIMDIKVDEKCDIGYEEAFKYTWPGVNRGCWCKNVNFFYRSMYKVDKDIYTSGCDTNRTRAGCTEIQSNPAVVVDTWGASNGKKVKICVKRSTETWADVAPKSGATCQDPGMKKCGTSPDNVFCTKEAKCPVNAINILTLDLSANAGKLGQCLNDTDCMILSRDVGTAKILQVQRGDTADGLPIAQFKLNEYSMCKTVGQDNITPNRKEFALLANQRYSCGNDGAKLWTLLDNSSEDQLFQLNGLMPIINYYQGFDYYQPGTSGRDFQWGIYARTYVPWKQACRQEMTQLVGESQSINSLRTTQLVLLIFAIIVGVIVGLIFPCVIMSSGYGACTKYFPWAGEIVVLILQIVAASASASIHNFFSDFLSKDCSNADVLTVFTDAGVGAGKAHSNDVAGIIVSLITLLTNAALLLYRSKTGQEYYPQVNEPSKK